jgi:acyl-coenzyme A synthetase/AMP-(fatty) acid ligase
VERATTDLVTGVRAQREVEDVLRAHPAIQDAAVVGLPDAEYGERVTAFVELRPGARNVLVAELNEFVKGSLASYKRPRAWRVVAQLPRNALGKVLKGVLKQQAGSQ